LITITEEPYDGPVAQGLVADLLLDLNARYDDADDEDEDWDEGDDEAYLAEVTPEMVERPNGVFLVAWVDGVPLSCGALKPLDDDPTVGEIKRMYTRPEGRRQGLGRRILAQLEATAVELGYPRLQLETGAPQPEALSLYERTGWHRIDPYGHYKDSPHSVCFAKGLAVG
jgi:GNAT superfamily N-acetyltransferase